MRYELRAWHDRPSKAERAAGWRIVGDEARARWILGRDGGRVDRTLEDLRLGQLLLVENDARPPVDALPRDYEAVVDLRDLAGPEHEETTWIEFVFEYPDRTKVAGLEYVLLDPGARESFGTLPANGSISRRGVAPGDYTIVIAEVEHAVWTKTRARRGDPIEVVARTCGYPDGTAATVKLYRERAESQGDELAVVETTVRDDVVSVVFSSDDASLASDDGERGVASFVAEVSVDGGRAWAKTIRPLQLERPRLRGVAWSTDRAEAGDTLAVVVDAAGFPAGTRVALEVWKLDWVEGDRKVLDLPAVELASGPTTIPVGYAPNGAVTGSTPAIDACGEYYVVATVDGASEGPVRSDFLWCVWAGGDDEAEPTAESEADASTRAA